MVLSENDIRPEKLEEGKLEALHADIERLAQHKSEFVFSACPACNTVDSILAYEKYGFTFDKCINCETVYMNPRATPEILSEFYSHSVLYAYWDRYIFPASREIRKERIFRPRVQRILELCEQLSLEPGVLVEVGSAAGMFCEEALATDAFKRVVGIEPSAAQAATCRKMGIDIIESTIEKTDGVGEPVNIVVSFETIEHVYSPRDFLSRCYELLVPNGLLVLTCPNYEGFDIMTLGSYSDSLDAEHINMFNPRSLKQLVESLGFEIVEISTPGELDVELVRKKVLDETISLDSQPFLQKVLVDNWEELGGTFQAYLQTNKLSSHMFLVAQRKS